VVVGPLCIFYQWWKANQKECSLPTVIHAFGRGFYEVTLMMICASYGVSGFSFAGLFDAPPLELMQFFGNGYWFSQIFSRSRYLL
jgi:hypothetical protein